MEATVAKKREITKLQRTKLPYLSPDEITEILLLTPTRSLGRFRCVSKLFSSLLSDPKFTKKHLDHNMIRSRHRRLILSFYNLFAVDFDSVSDGCEVTRVLKCVELDYPLKEDQDFLSEKSKRRADGYPVTCKRGGVRISGSSNGLVCIVTNENDVFLYNPTTGESKRVPDLPPSLRSISTRAWPSFYGFGFDSLTNDYKVVKFVDRNDNYVYSLRTDSWRRICNLPYKEHIVFNSSVELNGAIHWITLLSDGGTHKVVTAFDLKTEKFKLMSLPDVAEECHNHDFWNSTVGTLKGRLCVVNCCSKLHDVIWVMKEYGLVSSWSMIRITVSFPRMKPLCSTNNGEDICLVIDTTRPTWSCTTLSAILGGIWKYVVLTSTSGSKQICMWRASYHQIHTI